MMDDCVSVLCAHIVILWCPPKDEPRCQGSGKFPSSNTCTRNYAVYEVQPEAWKITAWADTMSTFIKSIDANHMVATGDEGMVMFWNVFVMRSSIYMYTR